MWSSLKFLLGFLLTIVAGCAIFGGIIIGIGFLIEQSVWWVALPVTLVFLLLWRLAYIGLVDAKILNKR